MSQAPLEFPIGPRVLALMEGDITKVPADAIGNAANSQLAGGGGVDGAIHRAGGPAIMRELDSIRAEIGRCATGNAVATGAGNLPARHVLHAVGPVYRDGARGEASLLESCYGRCLRLATEKDARSLTLPAISTGVYGYPLDAAAAIAVRTVADFLHSEKTGLERVTFVLFGAAAFAAFERAARDYSASAS